jgi:acyl-CoA thioester hydrolase
MSYIYELEVRGYELDSYNHVNNAIYLNYLEQARWEILKAGNLYNYFSENKLFLVITDIKIHFARELKIYDKIIIKTNIKKKAPYVIFNHKIYKHPDDDLLVSKAEVKTLLIDNEKIPIDFPDEFLK